MLQVVHYFAISVFVYCDCVLVFMQLPSCRESAADVECRYATTLQKIANKFHSEHILCIMHGKQGGGVEILSLVL